MSADDRLQPDRADEGEVARRVDPVSLVAGIVVAVLCAAYAFGDLDGLAVQARVVWPTILLGVGVGLLATGRRR
jgi:hypothetical protein